jgi:hypothetical protein
LHPKPASQMNVTWRASGETGTASVSQATELVPSVARAINAVRAAEIGEV